MRIHKFIPYGKLSKKKQREIDKKGRSTWGPLNPVTRRPENPGPTTEKKPGCRRMTDRSQGFIRYFNITINTLSWFSSEKASLLSFKSYICTAIYFMKLLNIHMIRWV